MWHLNVRWQARENDLIGGWAITPKIDYRSPAEGAWCIADFCAQETAEHIAELHNKWLDEARNDGRAGF